MIVDSLTPTELSDTISGPFKAGVFLAVCPGTIVYTVNVSISSSTQIVKDIDYDSAVGTLGDVKIGYAVYLSETSSINDTYAVLRITLTPTASKLYVTVNSLSIEAGQTIFVVKDVRPEIKPPYRTDVLYYKDGVSPFHKPSPLISNLDSAYFLNQDLATIISFAPVGSAIAASATILTWLWDLDGLVLESGTLTSKDISVTAPAPGHYLPRVQVTDSNAVSAWLTFHVFVVTNSEHPNIYPQVEYVEYSSEVDVGWSTSVVLIEPISYLRGTTMCVVSPATTLAPNDSEVVFVGVESEIGTSADREASNGVVVSSSVEIESYSTKLERFASQPLVMVDDPIPTEWDYIQGLNFWRAYAHYITEHTTIPNIASVSFIGVDELYNFPSFSTGDASVLASLNRLLAQNRYVHTFGRTGQFLIGKDIRLIPLDDRLGISQLVDLGLADVISDESGPLVAFENAGPSTVGRTASFGAYYISGPQKTQTLKARTPAKIITSGSGNADLNSQVLLTNTDKNSAYGELGEICANYFALSQPQDSLDDIRMLPGFRFFTPSFTKRLTWTLPSSVLGQDFDYDDTTYWFLVSLSIRVENNTRDCSVLGSFITESSSLNYQVVVSEPPTNVPGALPTLPAMTPYPNLPELTLGLKDPSGGGGFPPGESPVMGEESVAPANRPNLPGLTSSSGPFVLVWGRESGFPKLWKVTNLDKAFPDYVNIAPTTLSPTFTITQVIIARDGLRCWFLANDGVVTQVWRTAKVGQTNWYSTVFASTVYYQIQFIDFIEELYIRSQVKLDVPFDSFVLPSDTAGGVWTSSTPDTVTDAPYGIKVIGEFNFGSEPNYREDAQWRSNDTWSTWFRNDSIRFFDTNNTRQAIDSSYNPHEYDFLYTGDGGKLKVAANDAFTGFGGDNTGNFNVEVLSLSPMRVARSNDGGESFTPESVSDSIVEESAFAKEFRGDAIYLGVEEKLIESPLGGPFPDWEDADGAETAGTYPIAVSSYGTGIPRYFMASADFVSGDSLWRINNGVSSPISPVFEATKGLVVSWKSLESFGRLADYVWLLADFGGIVKFAFTSDSGGVWTASGDYTGSDEYCVAVGPSSVDRVYFTVGSTLYYSSDGGLSINPRLSPASNLDGVVAP